MQLKTYNVSSTRLGLASINERYKLLTGKSISISNTSEYFCVELPLINPSEYESPYSRG